MLNLQKNYLQKYQQIYPQSPDWNLIQYRLQLNLGNASAYLKKVYCVMNPYLNSQFERQNKGLIVSEVYVKPEDLVDSNRIQRVCQKGFQFPTTNKGLEFNVGQIEIDPYLKSDHQLLVVKICPRRSYPYLSKQAQEQTNIACPQGFDSIYFPTHKDKEDTYSHKFRLYKKMQTLPFYVIQFSFNPQHQRKLKTIVCRSCNDQVARIFCKTQNIYLCKKCDYEHHKNKISAQHERNPLTDKPILDFGYCHNHKNNKNQLFCKVCNVSMCMSCKIYGDHAQGFMASHELNKIFDYYMGTTKKINEMDPNLEKRKDQFEELLDFVDNKIKLVNQTAKKIQAELMQIFDDTLKNLQAIVHRKLSYLVSDQMEVRRQYDYIQWMESFLKYQYQVLPPNDFLISWTKHGRLRKQVLNLSNIPAVTDVKANFQVVGSLKIDMDGLTIGRRDNWLEQDERKDLRRAGQSSRQNESPQKSQTQLRKRLFLRPQVVSNSQT